MKRVFLNFLLVTGLHDLDEFVQGQLLLAALNITTHVLKTGGDFVAKIFRGKDVHILYDQMKMLFAEVVCCKPRSSRNSSIEAFVLGRGYNPPVGFNPTDLTKFIESGYGAYTERPAGLVEFVACGDLSCGYDSDKTYPLSDNYTWKEPVEPPTIPPYKEAVERKRQNLEKKIK